MCGKVLEETAAAAHRVPEAHPVEEPPTPAPAYTGGIFNLGAPADKPARNLDYLLEDDEPRSRRGLVVGILALALVAGLGWLRWRTGGFPGLKSGGAGTQTGAQTAPAETTSPAPSTAAPADQTGATSSPNAPTPNTSLPNAPAASAAVTTAPLTAPADAPAGGGGAAAAAGETAAGEPQTSTAVPPPADASAGEAPSTDSAAPAPSTARVVAPAPMAAAPAPVKPKSSPKPGLKPEDSVTLGEKYLYGRGVAQDCTRGLHYVKPAADQSNQKAMITMGALYATGHCLSRDLPTAYRFFALALRKDPDNGALKQNAEMVWSQMTQSERQLAIRMTK
jgi:hypothetical protein